MSAPLTREQFIARRLATYNAGPAASGICPCEACLEVNWRHYEARMRLTRITTEPIALPAPVAMTRRDELLAMFAEYGVTPIPDDEVTDMGDYILWNKFDPAKHLIMTPGVIRNIVTPLAQLRSVYSQEYMDDPRNFPNVAYPSDKPVRVHGMFVYEDPNWDGPGRPRTFYWYFCAGQARLARIEHDSEYSYSDLREVNNQIKPPSPTFIGRRATLADVPAAQRGKFIDRVLGFKVADGRITPQRHARFCENLAMVAISTPGWRDEPLARFAHHRRALKKIGTLVRDAEGHYACDILEAIASLRMSGADMEDRIMDAWNNRADSDSRITRATCGHLCAEDETHETRDGEVCRDCFDDNYVEVEDAPGYYHRDNVYMHNDGCYYTYPEERDDDEDDDYDEDEDEDEDNVDGRVKNYTTNVLNYAPRDTTVTPSVFGDFLMGVELEVVPTRGARNVTVIDTHDTLCQKNKYAILKNDGSLDNGGFEIVTAPRTLKEHIERFGAWVPHPKLRAWDPGCCGLHVHISSSAFSPATLGKFIEFINAQENKKMIVAIAGRHPEDGGTAATYCKTEGDMSLGNPKKNVQGKSQSRYYMVNTTTIGEAERERLGLPDTEGSKAFDTVELRIFRASLKKARLLAQIEFAHAAVMFCRWTSMRELREEHFKAWLQKAAGMYPNLAKWYGVRANTLKVNYLPEVVMAEEV